MFILSQDKTRIVNISNRTKGIVYEEVKDNGEIRHTIGVFDGQMASVAEYKTKEECLLVIYAMFKGTERGDKTLEIPTQEELEAQKEALKEWERAGKKFAEGAMDALKNFFNE